ncbi:MAG: hypothetical protein FWG91_07990 [Lachnospiraceae bacterium]|nr:hypothetical protein [Lachnospiraceae bacterium]
MPPLLAVGQRAETPYTFNRLLLSIYSVEELCYLFKTNPFILDDKILDRKLINWLEKSCHLKELAAKLSLILKKSKNAEEFVMAIIEYTGYLQPDEISRIRTVFQGNIGVNDYEKEVSRADFLLNSGKYQMAILEYGRILLNVPYGERLISGRIYHNRGVALARLFLFAQAKESFLKAYELNNSPESGRAYLLSVRLSVDEIEYIRFIAAPAPPIISLSDLSLEVEHIYNQAVSVYNETEEKLLLDELILDKEMGDGNSYKEKIEKFCLGAQKKYRTAVNTAVTV